jgi:hypothetical protein
VPTEGPSFLHLEKRCDYGYPQLREPLVQKRACALRTEGAVTTERQTALRVKNWGELYENNRSREIKRLDYVLVPNRMDTDGYTTLLDHPDGAAHLGAWIAILQIASRCKERGVLANADGRPHDARSLSRISRIPVAIFEALIPRLLDDVQWLEQVEEIPQEGAQITREGAVPTRAGDRVLIPVEISLRGSVRGESQPGPAPSAVAVENTGPLRVFEELQRIYKAGGLPIPERQSQLIVQYLVAMPTEKLDRLTNYVKWAFTSGRWPAPAKTKALLQLIRDGDWDVELTQRTLPDAVHSRPPSKAAEAQNLAAARVLEKYGDAL